MLLEYKSQRFRSSRKPAPPLQTLGPMNHAARFLTDAETICKQIPREKIELLADGLAQLRERGGRLPARRRRQRRKLQPCRERFQEAVRHRSLQPDR
jgi:hypothetical protein